MINVFRGQNFFLSNFYTCTIEYDGLKFNNVEAAFQAQKCVDDEQKKAFMGISGADAKSLGRRVKLRADWENVKVGIMKELVKQKFVQNPELLKRLIDTGDEELVEGNYWGDTFWGVDSRRGGKNMLGKILEEIRAEFKNVEGEENMKVYIVAEVNNDQLMPIVDVFDSADKALAAFKALLPSGQDFLESERIKKSLGFEGHPPEHYFETKDYEFWARTTSGKPVMIARYVVLRQDVK